MHCLTIQLSPPSALSDTEQSCWRGLPSTQTHLATLLRLSKQKGRFPEVDTPEHNHCIQLHYFSENLPPLWGDLRELLIDASDIKDWLIGHAIIACDGENGWDDMTVLYDCESGEIHGDLRD